MINLIYQIVCWKSAAKADFFIAINESNIMLNKEQKKEIKSEAGEKEEEAPETTGQ